MNRMPKECDKCGQDDCHCQLNDFAKKEYEKDMKEFKSIFDNIEWQGEKWSLKHETTRGGCGRVWESNKGKKRLTVADFGSTPHPSEKEI